LKLRVVAVGRLKEPHWRDAAAEYLKRLRPYATVEMQEVADRDIGRDAGRAMAEEAADLLRLLPPAVHVIVLDAGGRAVSSTALAERLSELMLSRRSDIAFVLGGSAGLARVVRERADETISLSSLTFPHQLARVILLEQLYRAFRIMRNEPYHR
jgi:23S rRNA (pseudouridine1915-N3)-methyltransferase